MTCEKGERFVRAKGIGTCNMTPIGFSSRTSSQNYSSSLHESYKTSKTFVVAHDRDVSNITGLAQQLRQTVPTGITSFVSAVCIYVRT